MCVFVCVCVCVCDGAAMQLQSQLYQPEIAKTGEYAELNIMPYSVITKDLLKLTIGSFIHLGPQFKVRHARPPFCSLGRAPAFRAGGRGGDPVLTRSGELTSPDVHAIGALALTQSIKRGVRKGREARISVTALPSMTLPCCSC